MVDSNSCKVCTVNLKYGLTDIDSKILYHWKGGNAERKGYRKLADWYNTILLQQRMDEAGLPTLGDEAKTKYQRLQGDDSIISKEVQQVLESGGVDVEELKKDFVSYGVIRKHIKDCLGGEREHPESDWEMDTIRISKEYSEKKVANAVRSLKNKNKLQVGSDIDVHAEFYVECNDCQERIRIDRALQREATCDCGIQQVIQ